MRKLALTIALLVTAANLAIGVSYAAVCQSSKGARACGTTCVATGSGTCECTGSCTKEERDWVGGGGGAVAEIEEGGVS
jgi:hypothetical protein